MENFSKIQDMLTPLGFECHPCKVGWYNDKVDAKFHLDYDYSTLAVVIISTPDMFEEAFRSYINQQGKNGIRDPVDDCIAYYFQQAKDASGAEDVDILHDFELHHNRRPKVLVQTAGHVSGAVTYYQRSDLKNDPWIEKKKVFGACIHPKYGGWFGLRGVFILRNKLVPDLQQKESPHTLTTDKDIVDFLEKYNFHWQDWTFRDVIPVEKRYSEKQRSYFETLPKNRKELLQSWGWIDPT